MIYKNYELPILKSIIDKLKTKNFSIQTQYKFIKIAKVVESEMAIYEEQKMSLIDTFGERDEQGNLITTEDGGIKIKSDLTEACNERIKEMNDMQIQFPDIYFTLDELEPLGLTFFELEKLEPFIKE